MSGEHVSGTEQRLGRYILERRIASGGMADVYLARQVGDFGFVKNVALKVLKSDAAADDDHVRMFLREALVAADFKHPNLVQVYEVGQADGKLFLAMELVRGISVATLMLLLAHKGRGIPVPIAARIALDVLDGLAYAHEARSADGQPLDLVHRDVSPQNILVSEEGVVKLVDFGIARAETVLGKTQVTRIKGKFSYMAPEQWEADATLDPRADLFSLGVVLYEMSTGSGRLFKGQSPPELYKAVVQDAIPPPTSRVPDYPEALMRVVMTALERDPAQRWPNARVMRTALAEAMESQGWTVQDRTLARIVQFSLDEQSIETRWEHIATGQIPSPGDEGSALVEELGNHLDSREIEPELVKPPRPERVLSRDPTVKLPAAHSDSEAPPEAYAAPMLPWVFAALGWVFAIVAAVQWTRAETRARSAESRLLAASRVRVEPRRDPPPVVPPMEATVGLLSDPSVATALAQPWGRMLEATVTGARVQLVPGDALGHWLQGEGAVALCVGRASDDAAQRARAAGIDLRASSTEHIVGYDHVVVVVHPTNRAPSLTVTQLARMLTGQSVSWSSVRGGSGAVHLVLGAPDTPPRRLIDALVLSRDGVALPVTDRAEVVGDEAAAVARVAMDPRAVALVRLAWVRPTVRALPLLTGPRGAAPVAAERDTIRALQYPLARPVVMYTRGEPEGAVQELLRVATSVSGQSVLERAGYISR